MRRRPSADRLRAEARLDRRGMLRVHVQRAAGLKAADRNGKSDPYVKVRVAGQARRQTRVIKATLEPVWDRPSDVLHFGPATLRDLVTEPVLLKVRDQDFGLSDDSLGDVEVDLRDEDKLGDKDEPPPFTVSLPTQGTVTLQVAFLPEQVKGADPLGDPAKEAFLSAPGRLEVVVEEGADLRATSTFKSDYMVRVSVHTDGGEAGKAATLARRQTSLRQFASTSPLWNEMLQFTGTLRALAAEPVEVLLLGKDPSKGELGRGAIALGPLVDRFLDGHPVTTAVHLTPQGVLHFTVCWYRASEPSADGPRPSVVAPRPLPGPGEPGAAELARVGELNVWVRYGRNLIGADKSGTSDPYAVIHVPNKPKVQTKVIRKTLNPEWNESFTFRGKLGCAALFTAPSADARRS